MLMPINCDEEVIVKVIIACGFRIQDLDINWSQAYDNPTMTHFRHKYETTRALRTVIQHHNIHERDWYLGLEAGESNRWKDAAEAGKTISDQEAMEISIGEQQALRRAIPVEAG